MTRPTRRVGRTLSRNDYRSDPRPRLAEAARDFADAWSVYTQWHAHRRGLGPGVELARLDRHFERRLAHFGERLAVAVDAYRADNAGGDTLAPEPLDNRRQEG